MRKALQAGRILGPLKKVKRLRTKSPRSVLDSQAALGLGCVRVEERVWAALGGLREAPTRFEPGREGELRGSFVGVAGLAGQWMAAPTGGVF